MLLAESRQSETPDEGLFIAGGAIQVHHLDPNVDFLHPPLLRWVAGIPAVVLGRARVPEPAPIVPTGPRVSFYYETLYGYTAPFFYDSGASHDRVLFWGRAPFALLGALLGWLLFAAARRLFGPRPALAALAAFAFTPEVLAHSQWAHSDVASALTLFLVAIALARCLPEGSRRSFVLLGAAMGLAIATKLTAIILWPPILLILLFFGRGSRLSLAKKTAAALAVTYAAVVISYLPKPRLFGPHEFVAADLEYIHLSAFSPLLQIVPLPDSFLKGVVHTALIARRSEGLTAFLHGQMSTKGWWYYFPVAVFLKYPTGLLLLAVWGLAILWRGRESVAVKLAATVPPAVIMAAAMGQSIDLGVRSVLPIAPFLALWAAAVFAGVRRRAWLGVAALLLATSVASGLFAYPDFLAYFNPLLGGTKSADKWLIDSNLDWGQSLPALARELRARGISEVRLDYFGAGRPSHWGIQALDPSVAVPGWYAISRDFLSGWGRPGDPYAWLRRMKPAALPGGSIALFHVTEADLSSDVDALMRHGLDALYGHKAPDAAIEDFRLVLRARPDHYGALYQLASALDQAGRPVEARPVWVRVLSRAESVKDEPTARLARDRLAQPDAVRVDTLMRLGLDSLYRLGDPLGAAERFREILRRNPEHYGALYQLASALDRAGRRSEARPYWEKVLAAALLYRDESTARTASERLQTKP